MSLVLVVDDEQPIRAVIRRALERLGLEAQEASDGFEALDAFERSAPDMVIVDILMPKKGGLQTIGEIRKRDPHVPILAISGGGDTGRMMFLSTARTYPGVTTLKKPFRVSELMGIVRSQLGLPRAVGA